MFFDPTLRASLTVHGFFAVFWHLNFSSPLVRVSSKFVLVLWYVQSVNECFYIPADIPQKAVYRKLASNSAIFSLHVRELFRFFYSSTFTTAKLPLRCLLGLYMLYRILIY